MRIVIDCFKLVKGSGKSIGIYNLTRNLVSHLAESPQKDVELVVLGNAYNKADFALKEVQFVEVKKNPQNKIICILWELFGVVGYAKKYKADRLLFPRGFRPLFYRGKDTIIVHDLIPFYYQENYPGVLNRWENLYITNRLKASIRHADRVITISEYSKKDIIERVPWAEDKICVIYNGLNKLPELPAEKKEAEGYFIAVTSELPHKNAKGIVDAYSKYCAMVDHPMKLRIIGIGNLDKYEVTQQIAQNITCIKYLDSDLEFYQMIKQSRGFLFLSLIEGFGFPPLEAMELGVPVLCSDRTSLGEVAGDAALLVDPEDDLAVARNMVRLEREENVREELIKSGYENCKRFDWTSRRNEYMKELTQH